MESSALFHFMQHFCRCPTEAVVSLARKWIICSNICTARHQDRLEPTLTPFHSLDTVTVFQFLGYTPDISTAISSFRVAMDMVLTPLYISRQMSCNFRTSYNIALFPVHRTNVSLHRLYRTKPTSCCQSSTRLPPSFIELKSRIPIGVANVAVAWPLGSCV